MDMKKSAFDFCMKAPSLLTVKKGNAVRHLLLLIYTFTCTALFSCSSKEYKDIVPKDSPAIARINLSALKNDAQLSDEQASAFVKKVIPFASGWTCRNRSMLLFPPAVISVFYSQWTTAMS